LPAADGKIACTVSPKTALATLLGIEALILA
jgi:hypothetical protein